MDFADQLYLIAGNAPPEEEKYKNVRYRHCPEITTKNRWKNLLRLFQRMRDLTGIIEEFTDNQQIDLVFLDYNFLGNYIPLFKARNVKVIYGTHNIQSNLNFQAPAINLKGLIYKYIRFTLERFHELRYLRMADSIIAVSNEDLEFYSRRFRASKNHMIPNYIDEKEYEIDKGTTKQNRVIMSGNFNAFQNAYGLKWFLESVWDAELASLTKFIIVGHGSQNQYDQIKESLPFTSNIEALGSVENMKRYIAESKAAVIPLLHGSGTRLKCIEAMALKTSIVGTSQGVEGIDHENSISIANNALDFKKGLLQILNEDVDLQNKAYNVFMKKYSACSNTPRLRNIVVGLLKEQ